MLLQAFMELFLHIRILVATNDPFPRLLRGQQAEAVHLEEELRRRAALSNLDADFAVLQQEQPAFCSSEAEFLLLPEASATLTAQPS